MRAEASQRQQHILDLVCQRGFVAIADLAVSLAVSEQTIRRDLAALGDKGLVSKVHGGAGLPHGPSDVGYDLRRSRFSAEKRRIAQMLAKRIPEGATVFIDIGTTMEAVAEALLSHRQLTILTNHLTVATILSRRSDFQIILAGGVLRHNDHAVTGEATREFLERFRVGYGIFGIGGVSPDGDLLDYDFRDIGVSETAMRISRRKFVALDHSKFETDAMVRIGDLASVDALFTDAPPPASIRRRLKSLGVELNIAAGTTPPPEARAGRSRGGAVV